MKSVRFALPLLLPLGLIGPLPAADSAAFTTSASGREEPAEIAALRSKAARGNSIAQYNLGLAFVEGRQVPANFSEAFVWLTLAAQSGSRGRALDALVGKMSPEQLAEGRRRLEG